MKLLSCVRPLATPWTAAFQAPPKKIQGIFQATVLEWDAIAFSDSTRYVCLYKTQEFLSIYPLKKIHVCVNLAMLHGMWDLSSSGQEMNPYPLHWKHRVLTTGLTGKSQYLSFK